MRKPVDSTSSKHKKTPYNRQTELLVNESKRANRVSANNRESS